MKKYNILLIALVVLFSACDDFLDKAPNKTTSVVPSSTEHYEFLLNNYSDFQSEGNRDIIYGSDDFGLLARLAESNANIYNIDNAHYSTWDVDYLPVQESRPYFSEEWEKVFKANMVLNDIDNVDGTEAEKEALKAEAYFIRAYSYYQMVNTYCLPYAAENMGEMGLPIKQSTSFEESAERVSLQETWDFILADLAEALKLNRALVLKDGKYRTWRASTPAINAFAARVYLSMNDYDKAISYAEAALGEHNAMMDYNTEMYFSSTVNTTIDGEGNVYTMDYPYTADGQGASDIKMQWKELYYFRFLSNFSWNNYPSDELLALYDADYDLRYKYHMVEGWSYDRGATIQHPAYMFFFFDVPSGPTTAEMLLIKAECQARTGDWQAAITTVNQLRSYRMDNAAPAEVINLSAASQDEAIARILEERRREMPFSQRYFDVRRFNNNDYAADDVVMTREFYPVGEYGIEFSKGVQTQTLEKKSRKFARPLPDNEIVATGGVMKQNTY